MPKQLAGTPVNYTHYHRYYYCYYCCYYYRYLRDELVSQFAQGH